MANPVISLCLPTNGIIEWVLPVLDSIYSQDVDIKLFEVIVTDNGSNRKFHDLMKKYVGKYKNFIYKKTNAYMFENQLEALKLANGMYFKFVNHRSIFTKGSLNHLISVISNYKKEKPVIYFSCGALKKDIYELNTFDSFVGTLCRYASWTTGVGIWKEDYKRIPEQVTIDKISPHSCILFAERDKKKYIIDNFVFSNDIEHDHTKKGKYDLFKAFAIEELTITLKLFIDGDISIETLKTVKKDYKKFLCELYFDFCIRKLPCSYDLSGFNKAMGIFYSKSEIILGAYLFGIKKILKKIIRK